MNQLAGWPTIGKYLVFGYPLFLTQRHWVGSAQLPGGGGGGVGGRTIGGNPCHHPAWKWGLAVGHKRYEIRAWGSRYRQQALAGGGGMRGKQGWKDRWGDSLLCVKGWMLISPDPMLLRTFSTSGLSYIFSHLILMTTIWNWYNDYIVEIQKHKFRGVTYFYMITPVNGKCGPALLWRPIETSQWEWHLVSSGRAVNLCWINDWLCEWKGLEQASPRCTALACEFFRAKGSWYPAGSRKTSTSLLKNLNWGLSHNKSYQQK